MNFKLILSAVVLFCLISLQAAVFKLEYSLNNNSAVYKAGEKIVFTIRLLENGRMPADKKISYQLWHDRRVIKKDTVSASEELVVETSSETPGWIYIKFRAENGSGREIRQQVKRSGRTAAAAVSGSIGAMVEPEKLLPFLEEPADFDAFWNRVKAELAAVPLKELQKTLVAKDEVGVFDIKVSCAGDKPVSGYLCMPGGAKKKGCPAYVSFHGSGVRSARKNVWMAKRGVIALDINAHGIENGKPREFYRDLHKNHYYKTLDKFRRTRYAVWNRHDRDLYYFKGVYMRVMRALEYVKSLPEWDGKHLIVAGASQGGAQVLAACALDKDVTFARAGVPALCDHSGCLANRRSGWPDLYTREEYRKNPEYQKCASYYDGAYFAKRIRCPIYMYTGFVDGICPPTTVFAAYNSIPAGVKKYMQTTPDGGHTVPGDQAAAALDAYINSITPANAHQNEKTSKLSLTLL